MRTAWKIILVIFVCIIGLSLVYFYHLGDSSKSSNITVVRRIIDPSKPSQDKDDTQIDQLLTNLSKDLATLQNSKDSPYLNELITDLKSF